MRKSFKRIALLAALVLSAGMIMGQTTVNFTAAEIVAGTTKQGVSVRTSYNAVSSNKQICKEGSTATKATVLEIKNTPGSNLADTFYAEIKCSSGITGLEIHGSTNASDAADEVCVFWNTTSPTNQNIDGATLVNLAGYAGSCSSNNTSVNVPSGTQTIRLFRQLKKFDSATHAFSSSAGNYGSGKTFYIVDVTVTIAGGGGDNPPTPPTPSSDATLSDLKVDGTTISGFDANTTSYNYTIAAGVTTIPTVSATATNTNAQVAITQATSVTGQASVVVTAQDNSTTKTYTVQFSQSGGTDPPTPPTPPTPTDLTLHETEIYESPVIAGGYGATLSVFNNREYEVYYASFDNSNNLSVTTTPVQKSSGVTTSISQYKCKATDGWFEMETSTSKSNYTMTATDEFQAGSSAVHKLLNNAYYKFHIKGYDQFSFYGKDNKANESNGKHFEVYVDGVKQAMTLSESASIRRFDITTGEHVIEVRGVGASNNEFYGFSLRVAYVPKLKHLKGNDSTQVVYETSAIRPITYYLKNYVSDAELVWNGNEATGISLVKGNNDTLFVQGNANCSSGVYQYTIQAKDATNTVVSSLNGSFTVDKKIELSSGGLNITVFANSSIKPVVFRCYVMDMNEVSIQWTTAAAPGLSFGRDAANHTVTLSGTPTQPGNYA